MSESTFGFRLSDALKALMERAAEIERRKAGDFVRLAVEDRARRVIERHERKALREMAGQ